MTYDISTLTENQIALLKGIDDAQFNEGPDFGAWYDNVVNQAFEKGIIKTKQQTKATLNQLIRKGVLAVDTTVEEGSSWLSLTAAGGDALSALADADEDVEEELEEEEDLLGDTGAIDIVVLGQDVLAGTPEDEVAEALAEIEEEEDLLGDLGGVEATTAVETVVDTITKEQVITHVENYKVNEWKDADDTEWTETIFEDGSRTLKRRREVSGAWRTDYWGSVAGEDKDRATTSKLAKLARVNGSFKLEA